MYKLVYIYTCMYVLVKCFENSSLIGFPNGKSFFWSNIILQYTYVHTCICMNVCMYTYVCAKIVYKRIWICIHTYIHADLYVKRLYIPTVAHSHHAFTDFKSIIFNFSCIFRSDNVYLGEFQTKISFCMFIFSANAQRQRGNLISDSRVSERQQQQQQQK